MEKDKQVVLVTGASSGIGNACATYLGKKGYRVYGTSRDPRKYDKKADEFFELLRMDVSDEASVKEAVGALLSKEGRIDLVVNNAGTGIAGSVEETTDAEARKQFDTNFFGALNVIRAVLPQMRRQQSGKIINISSVAGKTGIPFQSMYAASKHAIEGLTESLRLEIRPFKVQACLIEPGDFETGFTAARTMIVAATEASPYRECCGRAMEVQVHDETHGHKPIAIAKLIAKLAAKKKLRVRYTIGPFIERFALVAKRFLSSNTFERIFKLYYKQ